MKKTGFGDNGLMNLQVFLYLSRWTALLFALFTLLVQKDYNLMWDFSTITLICLLVYNFLISFIYGQVIKQRLLARLLILTEIVVGVSLITMTGYIKSPFLLYVLTPVFTYMFFFKMRGVLETAAAFTITILSVNALLKDLVHPMMLSLEDGVLLLIQVLFLFAVVIYPSMLLTQMTRKEQKILDYEGMYRKAQENNKHLLELHELSGRINAGHPVHSIMNRLVNISCRVFNAREGALYLLTEQGIKGFGTLNDEDESHMEHVVQEYIQKWDDADQTDAYWDKDTTMIPLDRGKALEGILVLKGADSQELSNEDALLFSVIASMVSAYFENADHLHVVKQRIIDEEQKRIARDLHDGPAQSLFLIGAEIQKSRKLLGKESEEHIDDRLARIQKRLLENVQEIRRYIYDLRSGHGHVYNVTEAIGSFLHKVEENFHMDIDFIYKMEKGIPPEIGEQLIYIIQEGVNNTVKHAQASRITVHLQVEDEIALTMNDDGKGFDLEAMANQSIIEPKFGLQGMKERIESMDGYFQVRTGVGEGTALYITIPNGEGGKYDVYDQIAYSRRS